MPYLQEYTNSNFVLSLHVTCLDCCTCSKHIALKQSLEIPSEQYKKKTNRSIHYLFHKNCASLFSFFNTEKYYISSILSSMHLWFQITEYVLATFWVVYEIIYNWCTKGLERQNILILSPKSQVQAARCLYYNILFSLAVRASTKYKPICLINSNLYLSHHCFHKDSTICISLITSDKSHCAPVIPFFLPQRWNSS